MACLFPLLLPHKAPAPRPPLLREGGSGVRLRTDGQGAGPVKPGETDVEDKGALLRWALLRGCVFCPHLGCWWWGWTVSEKVLVENVRALRGGRGRPVESPMEVSVLERGDIFWAPEGGLGMAQRADVRGHNQGMAVTFPDQ